VNGRRGDLSIGSHFDGVVRWNEGNEAAAATCLTNSRENKG